MPLITFNCAVHGTLRLLSFCSFPGGSDSAKLWMTRRRMTQRHSTYICTAPGKEKKTFKSGNHSLEEYAQWRLGLEGCAQIVTYAVVGQKTWEGSVCVSVCRFYWVYFESLTWCSGKCYLFINLKTFYIKTNELVLLQWRRPYRPLNVTLLLRNCCIVLLFCTKVQFSI